MARPPKFEDDNVVLDRAVELFWRSGVDAVSIRDLETALDLRAPSIYRRFASREGLLVRCIDRYVEQEVGGRVRYFLTDSDDPLDGLGRFFTSALGARRGERRLRGCLLTTTAASEEASAPEVRAAIDRGFRAIQSGFRRQLEQARAVGQLDHRVDVDAGAAALLMSFQGLLVLARSGTGDLSAGIEATLRPYAAQVADR